MRGVTPPNRDMYHSREKFRLWLIISAAYLLLTGWVIWYSATCEEMFCHFAMWFVGLPWTPFFSSLMESLSLGGWIITIVLFALLNIAILYVLLGGAGAADPNGASDG